MVPLNRMALFRFLEFGSKVFRDTEERMVHGVNAPASCVPKNLKSYFKEHHALILPHPRTPAEQKLIDLNIRFVRSEDPAVRATLNAALAV